MGRPKKIITPPIETVTDSMQEKPTEAGVYNYTIVDDEAKFVEHVIPDSNNDGSKIIAKYLEKCNEISDINELLPIIYEIAKDCNHCTEFGVRIPTSTYALLAAKPKRLVSYDIGRYPEVDEVERLCEEAGQDFEFVLANILEVEIEETDLIFSDAFHSKSFVEKELELHAHKARKYIIFHDWTTYGEIGEQPYNDETSPYGAGFGIKYAIEPFLESHPEWVKHLELLFNNGLLILKRQ